MVNIVAIGISPSGLTGFTRTLTASEVTANGNTGGIEKQGGATLHNTPAPGIFLCH